MWQGGAGRLVELDTWTLMNLDLDVLAGLPAAIAALGIAPARLTRMLAAYSVQNVGLVTFYRSFMQDVPEPPVLLAPATRHYSWPKAATLLGLGQNAMLVQRVDRDARLDLDARRADAGRTCAAPGAAAVRRRRDRQHGGKRGGPAGRAAGAARAVPRARAELRHPRRRRLGRLLPHHAARGRADRAEARRADLRDERLRAAPVRPCWARRTASPWTRTRAATSPTRPARCATATRRCATPSRCRRRWCSTARRSRRSASTAWRAPSPAPPPRRSGWRTG